MPLTKYLRLCTWVIVNSIFVNATEVLFERFWWRELDFAYPSDGVRQSALATQRFVPENNLPVGIEVWNDKVFVTVPRWRQGK